MPKYSTVVCTTHEQDSTTLIARWKVTTAATGHYNLKVTSRNMTFKIQNNPPGMHTCMHMTGQCSVWPDDITLCFRKSWTRSSFPCITSPCCLNINYLVLFTVFYCKINIFKFDTVSIKHATWRCHLQLLELLSEQKTKQLIDKDNINSPKSHKLIVQYVFHSSLEYTDWECIRRCI